MILKWPSDTIIGRWKSSVVILGNFHAETVNAALTVFAKAHLKTKRTSPFHSDKRQYDKLMRFVIEARRYHFEMLYHLKKNKVAMAISDK